jgi:glycosyltransferase involved in cell wall biosynthesis
MTSPSRTPLVSVVTPVYNGLPHLVECIESVLSQTYQNWEYVIANNCSTDGTLETALRYAHRDSRIRVHVNDKHVNMSVNHDIALGQMSGGSEYCKIVHADDFLFPECLERMVAVAVANPSVGLVGAYRLDDRFVNLDGLPYPSTVVSGDEIRRRSLLEGLFVFGSPSSLLVRADLVRARRVFIDDDTFFMHGDTAACHEMLAISDFGFVHQVLTFTRRHAAAADTPRAIELNSYLSAESLILKKFGRQILTDAEYDACVKAHRREYYSFLGQSVLARKNPEFWSFHARALAAIGEPVEYRRLARATFAENRRRCVLHPISALSRLSEAIEGLRHHGDSGPAPVMGPEVSRGQV